jgi:hypothetical protein
LSRTALGLLELLRRERVAAAAAPISVGNLVGTTWSLL